MTQRYKPRRIDNDGALKGSRSGKCEEMSNKIFSFVLKVEEGKTLKKLKDKT